MTVLESLLVSVFGMLVVFAVLAVLMLSIRIMSRISGNSGNKAEAAPPTAKRPADLYASSGTVSTFDVPDPAAAMLMAIVADEMAAPLCELKFVSIKEIGEQQA